MELVTGATGIVGMHRLAWLLERDFPVRAMRRAGSDVSRCLAFLDARASGKKAQLEWVEADLDDVHSLEEAMSGVDTVFHAAGMVSFETRNKSRLFEVNTRGTKHVVDAALAAGVSNLIYISSVAAVRRFGPSSPAQPVREDTEWNGGVGASIYGKSKRAGEMEAWRGSAEGLNVVALCPSIVIGAGNFKASSGEMWSRVDAGMSWTPSGASGFVAATDIAAISGALLEAGIAGQPGIWGERFIVNEGTHLFKEVLGEIAEALKRPSPTKSPPAWLLYLAYRPLEWWAWISRTPPLLTKELVDTATSSVYYSTEKLAAVLPEFQFTSIPEAISKTAELYSR